MKNRKKNLIKLLTKKFLIKEYIQNKKHAIQIAEEVKCSVHPIYDRLKKYKIKIRTTSESHITHGGTLKKHYCKEKGCNNEISWQTAVNGEGRCLSCARKEKNNPMFGVHRFGKESANYKEGHSLIQHFCKEPDCNNKISYPNFLHGNKRCHFCANSGRNNSRFGKPSAHGKRIHYNRIYMRSTWETLFAQFLSLNGIKWTYEPERFYFEDCSYCPDFYIPEWDLYVEIKGWWRDNTKKRFNLFKKSYPNENIQVLMQKELEELGII